MQRRVIVAGFGLFVLAASVLCVALGLITLESHRGFFAPTWGEDGRSVYFLERRSRGLTWGPGWEFFTPPAHAYVISDSSSLRVLDASSGQVRTLLEIGNSPLVRRVTSNYRGRIFSSLSAGIDATASPLRFWAQLSIPRVPSSELWQVAGTWPGNGPAPAWIQGGAVQPRVGGPVLEQTRELMLSDGAEGYPCAILSVAANGSYDVLLRNAEFDARYPQGVPRPWLDARSRRAQILRMREFEATHAALVETFLAQGMSEGQASLAAYERMKQTGHLPRDPAIVATEIDAAPDSEPVFEIPSSYFAVGLFRDIASAIAAPGTAVATGTGDYLKYYDDDVGKRLREFRNTHDVFHVNNDGKLYRLDVEHPRTR